MESGLSLRQKIGYATGHVLNDLCASMWFTYLLLFYHKVLQFNNQYAGVVLLVGQLADGISTTIVGLASDRYTSSWMCVKYGSRKSWHLIGTICVVCSFPFIFLCCLGCTGSAEWVQLIYYCLFAVVFQYGWASVQISHLALIPTLSHCQNERTELTAIRYAMTVASNILVYLVAWAFFGVGHSEREITSADDEKFRNIMLVVIGVGSFASFIFHFGVKEVQVSTTTIDSTNGDDSNLVPPPQADGHVAGSIQTDLVVPMTMRNWLLEPQFYQIAGVYMSTRLFVNLSQAYMPLYLQESLQLHATYVAIIPLVMFVAGFVATIVMKTLNRKAGRKITYLLGSLMGVSSAVFVYYGSGDWFKSYGIYCAACMYGIGGTTVLITSLSLTAELISQNKESAAFVYGAMSFTDKVSNGLAVMAIQTFVPSFKHCDACRWYYRDVLFYATGGAALLGSLFVATLIPFTVGKRWRDRERYVHIRVDDDVSVDERTPLLI